MPRSFKERKYEFTVRLSPEVLTNLKTAAGKRGVPVRDYARLCLERGMAEEMIFEAQERANQGNGNGRQPALSPVLSADLKEEIRPEEVLLFVDELLRARFAKDQPGIIREAAARARTRVIAPRTPGKSE